MNTLKSDGEDLYLKKKLLGVISIALILRILSGIYSVSLGEQYWLHSDYQYDLIASNIASGKGYYIEGDYFEGLGTEIFGKEKIFSVRSPLYPFTLASIYVLFGRNPFIVILFQALISTATVFLIYCIGKRFFGTRVGLWAAVISALYPYSIYHDVRIFDTSLFEFLMALVILSAITLNEKKDLRMAWITGMLTGLAIHCRSAFMTFPPFLLISIWLAGSFPLKKFAQIAFVISFATFITIAPWLVRNYHIHHKWVLSTYGGWNFYLGNNVLTKKIIQERKEIDQDISREIKKEKINLKSLSEVELDQWFFRQGINFIKENPAEFFKLLWLKTINLWSLRINPPSANILQEITYTVSYGFVFFLGIWGMVLAGRAYPMTIVIYILFFYFTISYIPFITLSRYRKVLDPYLGIFAAYLLTRIWQRFKEKGKA